MTPEAVPRDLRGWGALAEFFRAAEVDVFVEAGVDGVLDLVLFAGEEFLLMAASAAVFLPFDDLRGV